MPARTRSAVVLVALGMAACGGGPDIAGLYAVETIESSSTACEGGAAPDPAPTHFQVAEDEIFGQTIYTLETCSSSDPATCDGGGGFVHDEIDGGYRGEVSGYSGTTDGCQLFYSRTEAILDGDVLTWTSHEHGDAASGDDCTTDEAAARGSEMPCIGYELIGGVRTE